MRRLAVLLFLTPALPAAAAPLTGAEIRAGIVGNTVQGSMIDTTACSEHYAPDGTIRAADYRGAWTVEGDRMCLAYDATPVCFGVDLAGDRVTRIGEDGIAQGTGTLLPGNPSC